MKVIGFTATKYDFVQAFQKKLAVGLRFLIQFFLAFAGRYGVG